MTMLDTARRRYSVRKYKDKEVEKDIILQVLEAARIAPSAVNYQPWHFIVLTDENIKNMVAETYSGKWLKDAPVIIAACGDHSLSWKRKDGKDHCDIDLAIAVNHLTLAAVELGLGTCWVCAFDAKSCHQLLNLPDNLEVIALLPIGYPLEEIEQVKNRKNMEEIVSWESYGS